MKLETKQEQLCWDLYQHKHLYVGFSAWGQTKYCFEKFLYLIASFKQRESMHDLFCWRAYVHLSELLYPPRHTVMIINTCDQFQIFLTRKWLRVCVRVCWCVCFPTMATRMTSAVTPDMKSLLTQSPKHTIQIPGVQDKHTHTHIHAQRWFYNSLFHSHFDTHWQTSTRSTFTQIHTVWRLRSTAGSCSQDPPTHTHTPPPVSLSLSVINLSVW